MFDNYNGVREETQEIALLIFKLKKCFYRRKLVLKSYLVTDLFPPEVALHPSVE